VLRRNYRNTQQIAAPLKIKYWQRTAAGDLSALTSNPHPTLETAAPHCFWWMNGSGAVFIHKPVDAARSSVSAGKRFLPLASRQVRSLNN